MENYWIFLDGECHDHNFALSTLKLYLAFEQKELKKSRAEEQFRDVVQDKKGGHNESGI